MAQRIKKPKSKKSYNITVNETPNYNNMPPIFSLEKLATDKYCFSSLDKDDQRQFAQSIFKRRQLLWKDIYKQSRHGLGIETIPIKSIKASIPSYITEDITEFVVFRFSGKKPMIGYREKNIFFVIWFDKDFTLYSH